MIRDEVIRKNLDLHAEWMKYTFENPDVLDRIPKGAVLVLEDKELYEETTLEENRRRTSLFFVVTMKMPSLIYPILRLSQRNFCWMLGADHVKAITN
jgi:hypothetical protein